MKNWKWMRVMALCALGTVVFASCDNDDDDRVMVPDAVTSAFAHQYSAAGYVEWDMEPGGYYVAEFRNDGRDHEAWYTSAGVWTMTEVDYGRSLQSLPQTVQDGYAASRYAADGWTVDDIDEIQRPAYETIYRIEIEKRGAVDRDLYFDLGGTLYRDEQDGQGNTGNGGMVGTQLPQSIKSYVDSMYAGATVVDFDIEASGMMEVDLRHNGVSKEVMFDSNQNWVMTKTDCTRNVPAAVAEAVRNEVPGARIDDCDYVETPSGNYYIVETDNPDRDFKVTADGTVSPLY